MPTMQKVIKKLNPKIKNAPRNSPENIY